MKLLHYLCALLFVAAVPAKATVIIDSGSCTSGCFPLPLGSPYMGHTFDAFGITFTTDSIFELTSISSVFSGYGTGSFSIYSLSGGLPDQQIFSQSFAVPVHSGLGEYSVSLDAWLQPGTWALVATPDPGVTSLTGVAGLGSPSYTVYPSYAKVDGTWHVLPTVYTNRGLAFRLTGNAVPEPATWAMMLAGFALVGAAMRRVRKEEKKTLIPAFSR